MAVVTLVLALSLGVVASRIRLVPARRLILFLPVILLGHWFIQQVKAIRAKRRKESEGDRERCHLK
jgi:uncharacterized membrane protein